MQDYLKEIIDVLDEQVKQKKERETTQEPGKITQERERTTPEESNVSEKSYKDNLGYKILQFIKLYFYSDLMKDIQIKINTTEEELEKVPYNDEYSGNSLVFALLNDIKKSLITNKDLINKLLYLLSIMFLPLGLHGTTQLKIFLFENNNIKENLFSNIRGVINIKREIYEKIYNDEELTSMKNTYDKNEDNFFIDINILIDSTDVISKKEYLEKIYKYLLN